MKHKSSICLLILLLTTFIGFWAIPDLVKKSTYSPQRYPFVYYSSLLKQLCFIDFGEEYPMTDSKGNKYTEQESDSLLPFFSFRQLMSDGKMPEKIDGHKVDMPLLRSKTIMARQNPETFQTPELGLYILYEAMPKRVNQGTPKDVFRLTDRIEFIDIASNTVDQKKSAAFQKELLKEGYTFPAQWVSGNMNPMKAYEEGFFSLDAEGKLFHFKMVNGRPFVRNTHVSDSIDVAHFSMLEMGDKRFYGFLYDKQGRVYIIEAGGGKYTPLQLDIDPIDIEVDQWTVMGNLLYWTVSVNKPDREIVYGLKTETLERVAQHEMMGTPNKWDKVSNWLFPVYITIEHRNSDYIYPKFNYTTLYALITNALLAIGLFVFTRRQNTKNDILIRSSYLSPES